MRRRYDYRYQQRKSSTESTPQRPNPAIVPPTPSKPTTSTEGMRRVGVRPAGDGSAAGACNYTVGQRVEHARFGPGTINAIETLSTDHKLIVAFDNDGEKTLLAKFAKLQKL